MTSEDLPFSVQRSFVAPDTGRGTFEWCRPFEYPHSRSCRKYNVELEPTIRSDITTAIAPKRKDESMGKHRMGALMIALVAAVLGLGIGFLLQGNWSSGAVAAPLAQPTQVSSSLIPRFISLDPYGAYVTGATTFSGGFGPNSGLRLPDGAISSFNLGFTLPPDYASGTPLTIRMVWHTPSTSCTINFRPSSIAIARPGQNHIQGSGASDGLSVVGGTTLNAPGTANSSQQPRSRSSHRLVAHRCRRVMSSCSVCFVTETRLKIPALVIWSSRGWRCNTRGRQHTSHW